ncbi:MAG: hypothetical protein F6K11_24620 [Leptolyngbya sp. SIO3F4]|nr:hypothetical protein [Leptolyngbya sp. SIO3F4]
MFEADQDTDQTFIRKQFEQEIIRDKVQFFQNYPLLSHDRFRAFNYCDCDDVWNTENVSGFQMRVARLLGFQDGRRRDLNHYCVDSISDVVLSVRCSASAPSLVTTTTYSSEEEALAEREAFLRVLLHPCFYTRLTYKPFYQYGLEVRCIVEGDTIAFRYDRYFPSRIERQQALDLLLAYLMQYYDRLSEAQSEPEPESESTSDLLTPSSDPDDPKTILLPNSTIDDDSATADTVKPPKSLISAVLDGDETWRIQLVIPNEPNEIEETSSELKSTATDSTSTTDSEESENSESSEDIKPENTTIVLAEPARFISNKAYESATEASEAGKALLEDLFIALCREERYCGIVLLSEDAAEEDKEIPKTIPYFGYALKHPNGSILAETSLIDHEGQELSELRDRFISETERDLALKAWFCHLEANQNRFEFQVVSNSDDWRFQVASLANNNSQSVSSVSEENTSEHNASGQNDGPELIFKSKAAYPTSDAAWDAATVAASSLRRRSRYLPTTSSTDTPSVGITDTNGTLLMEACTDQDLAMLFKQLNNLDVFLRFEAVAVSEPPSIRYRYRLIERPMGNQPEVTLLQSIETYPDEATANGHFYQDVLAVLFEPGVICPNQTQDGFGFRLLSQPGDLLSEVAENVETYATEEERDGAIEKIFLLVLTARYEVIAQPLTQILPVYDSDPSAQSSKVSKYRGQIRPNNGPILLQGRWGYADETAAWEHGDTLMEIIQEQQNFRTIEGDGIYGWELTNPEKDQIWARRYHPCDEERTQFISELQRWANDEGFYLLEHILLRPRSQQIPLAEEVDCPEKPVSTSSTKSLSTLTNEPSESEPVTPSHDQELDKFLPIIVKPEDANQYDITDPNRLARQDPYSFWVTVVLPYWPRRFRDVNFRHFVERTLRLEAPAHVALKIAWVNVHQLHQFQTAYRPWLEQLAQYTCQGTACDLTQTLNQLLDILPRLRNVYPKATLHNCDQNRPGDSPILLNRTAIGNAND